MNGDVTILTFVSLNPFCDVTNPQFDPKLLKTQSNYCVNLKFGMGMLFLGVME